MRPLVQGRYILCACGRTGWVRAVHSLPFIPELRIRCGSCVAEGYARDMGLARIGTNAYKCQGCGLLFEHAQQCPDCPPRPFAGMFDASAA